jgi:hypothetical protein
MSNYMSCPICKRLKMQVTKLNVGEWCYCHACKLSASLKDICYATRISEEAFLQQYGSLINNQTTSRQPPDNLEMPFPPEFSFLSNPDSKPALDYLATRGLSLKHLQNVFYNPMLNAIVFPYYYKGQYAGCQQRLIKPSAEGPKMITQPGTKTGSLVYGWDQSPLSSSIKNIVICEGAINALSLRAACPNKDTLFVAIGGSSTKHINIFKQLVKDEFNVICAFDTDKAGFEATRSYMFNNACTAYAYAPKAVGDWNDILILHGVKHLWLAFEKGVKAL